MILNCRVVLPIYVALQLQSNLYTKPDLRATGRLSLFLKKEPILKGLTPTILKFICGHILLNSCFRSFSILLLIYPKYGILMYLVSLLTVEIAFFTINRLF